MLAIIVSLGHLVDGTKLLPADKNKKTKNNLGRKLESTAGQQKVAGFIFLILLCNIRPNSSAVSNLIQLSSTEVRPKFDSQLRRRVWLCPVYFHVGSAA